MRCSGIADEAHSPRREIVEAADVIVQLAASVHRKRIDGEVAPPGVGGEIAAETHLGPAAVGLDVFAQRGDFEMRAVDDQGQRAVIDAGRHDAQPRAFGLAQDILRHGRDREVDVGDRFAEQGVAHGAADHAHLVARQRGKHLLQSRSVKQGPDGLFALPHHWNRPGVSRPFSTCAGT